MTDPLVQMNARLQQNQGGNSAMDALQQGLQTGLVLQQLDDQKRAEQVAQNMLIQKNVMLRRISDTPPAQRTAQMYTDYSMYFPTEAESMRKNWETMDATLKEDSLKFAGTAMALDSTGDFGNQQKVNKMFLDRAEAERSNGNEQMAQYYSQVAGMDPGHRQTSLGIMLATIPEGQKVLTALSAREKATLDQAAEQASTNKTISETRINEKKLPGEVQKTQAEIDNLYSQIQERGLGKKTQAKADLKAVMQGKVLDAQIKGADSLLAQAQALQNDVGQDSPEFVKSWGRTLNKLKGDISPATKFAYAYKQLRQDYMGAMTAGHGVNTLAEWERFDKTIPNENAPISLQIDWINRMRTGLADKRGETTGDAYSGAGAGGVTPANPATPAADSSRRIAKRLF